MLRGRKLSWNQLTGELARRQTQNYGAYAAFDMAGKGGPWRPLTNATTFVAEGAAYKFRWMVRFI